MKILIVRTFPSIISPNQYNVQETGLAKALTRAGHTCGVVLYYGKNKDTIEKLQVPCGDINKEILIYRLRGYNFLKNGFFPSLKKIVDDYDIIQVHEYDQITSWLYYAWNKKPVVIYHGPFMHMFNKRYNTKCYFFDRIFLKLRHRKEVVCLTKSRAAKVFLEQKGFTDVTAVGVGLDEDNFYCSHNITDNAIVVPKDKFNLLYVGKIEKRRNSYFLLEVMHEVSKGCDDINCIIIGSGEVGYVKEFLDKAKPLIDSGRLQYYSEATQNQLRDVYQKVQLMLFPTHYDIFGMVLLEALYFKLPVISTPNGGSDMLIRDGENGWILPDDALLEWVGLIENLCVDKEKYLNVCNVLKDEVSKKLCWDGLVNEFICAYGRAYDKYKS